MSDNKTSEDILGFASPPEHQCSFIDKLVKSAKHVDNAVNRRFKVRWHGGYEI